MFKQFWNWVFGLFKTKKIYVVTFVGMEDCVCQYVTDILNSIPQVEVISINDLSQKEHLQELQAIRDENVVFLLHGNAHGTAFYNTLRQSKKIVETIECSWWKNIESLSLKNVIFHVCHGSVVISKCAYLQELFINWVSYSGQVSVVYSKHEKIIELNRYLFNNLVNELRMRNDSSSLKQGLEQSYKRLGKRLVNDNGEKMVGYSFFVQTIGQNIDNLISK